MVGFFDKDLDLGLFDPFKDVKDDILLEEEDIHVEEERLHQFGMVWSFPENSARKLAMNLKKMIELTNQERGELALGLYQKFHRIDLLQICHPGFLARRFSIFSFQVLRAQKHMQTNEAKTSSFDDSVVLSTCILRFPMHSSCQKHCFEVQNARHSEAVSIECEGS
ncbi:hypothetical protein JHK87_016120 [Glycine soja]|nr:hypothetical protein JHK87_016120 [Glycine soja]